MFCIKYKIYFKYKQGTLCKTNFGIQKDYTCSHCNTDYSYYFF